MRIIYKGKIIEPYESFYHNTTLAFFRGQLGGGNLDALNATIRLL